MKDYIILGVSLVFFSLGVFSFHLGYGYKIDSDKKISEVYNKITQEENGSIGGSEEVLKEEVTPPEDILEVEGFVFPVHEKDFIRYSSFYGRRISPILNIVMNHKGLDIKGIPGFQIVSISDGEVVDNWPAPGTRVPGTNKRFKGHPVYGGMIRIKHTDGSYALYGHLSETWVSTGERINKGQVIGRAGNTGLSTGEHLHLEIFSPGGENVNPLLYIPNPK